MNDLLFAKKFAIHNHAALNDPTILDKPNLVLLVVRASWTAAQAPEGLGGRCELSLT
jgi:hypothetical protein